MATLQLTANARPDSLRLIRNVVASFARETGVPDAEVYAVKMSVNEAVANAVQHAYPEGETGPVEVDVREVGDELDVIVRDHGRPRRRKHAAGHDGFGLSFISRLPGRCTFTAATSGTTVEMVFPRRRRRAGASRHERPASFSLG